LEGIGLKELVTEDILKEAFFAFEGPDSGTALYIREEVIGAYVDGADRGSVFLLIGVAEVGVLLAELNEFFRVFLIGKLENAFLFGIAREEALVELFAAIPVGGIDIEFSEFRPEGSGGGFDTFDADVIEDSVESNAAPDIAVTLAFHPVLDSVEGGFEFRGGGAGGRACAGGDDLKFREEGKASGLLVNDGLEEEGMDDAEGELGVIGRDDDSVFTFEVFADFANEGIAISPGIENEFIAVNDDVGVRDIVQVGVAMNIDHS
jgi:hypothetical protein